MAYMFPMSSGVGMDNQPETDMGMSDDTVMARRARGGGVSPDKNLLALMLSRGNVGGQQQMLAQQLAQAQALRGDVKDYGTPGGTLMGGLGTAIQNLVGATREQSLQEKQKGLMSDEADLARQILMELRKQPIRRETDWLTSNDAAMQDLLGPKGY